MIIQKLPLVHLYLKIGGCHLGNSLQMTLAKGFFFHQPMNTSPDAQHIVFP